MRIPGPGPGVLAVAFVALVRLLAAQLPAADEAFRRGDYGAARAAYARVLAADSLNVQAWYRLAILDSWGGALDRSLERFARARRLAPRDEDVMVAQAAALAWSGRRDAAEALYDSVLARSPRRPDALAGRARVVAWSGDLRRSERLWRAALDAVPDNPELLLGLAQTLYWQGHPILARTYVARARTLAPSDTAAMDLERSLRAALRPEVQTNVDGAGDSDDNDFVAQEATLNTSFGEDRRGALHAGWRRATLQGISATSYGGGASLSAALGDVLVHAGLGVRRLEPEVGPSHTPLTGELGIGIRPARYATLSLDYDRSAFDETAPLIASGFVIDALDLSVDISPTAGWSISGGAGGAWISDTSGNRRYSATLTVLAPLAAGLQVGPAARIMGFRTSAPNGYFAPDRFTVIEGRVVYAVQRERWGVRGEGGVGSQQIAVGAPHQTEWHIGMTLSRGWGDHNELALVGAITNSAAATAAAGPRPGPFRYRSLGLRFTQGL